MPPLPGSRYWNCRAKVDEDTSQLYLEERDVLDPDEIFDGSEITHIVIGGQTLSQIAGLYWITGGENPEDAGPEHWRWIIADLNGIDDETLDLAEGTTLLIPTLATVKEKIFGGII